MSERLVTLAEAANYLGLCQEYVRRRITRHLPVVCFQLRANLYRLDDIVDAYAKQKAQSKENRRNRLLSMRNGDGKFYSQSKPKPIIKQPKEDVTDRQLLAIRIISRGFHRGIDYRKNLGYESPKQIERVRRILPTRNAAYFFKKEETDDEH